MKILNIISIFIIFTYCSALSLFAQSNVIEKFLQTQTLYLSGEYDKTVAECRSIIEQSEKNISFYSILPHLITQYHECAAILGQEDVFRKSVTNLMKYSDKNDINNYLKVFFNVLATYKGVPSDSRYQSDRKLLCMSINSCNALSFYDSFVPDLSLLDSSQRFCVLMAKAEILMIGKKFEEMNSILKHVTTLVKTEGEEYYSLELFKEIALAYQGRYSEAIDKAMSNAQLLENAGLSNSQEYISVFYRLQIYLNHEKKFRESIESIVDLSIFEGINENCILLQQFRKDNPYSFIHNIDVSDRWFSCGELAESYYQLGNFAEAEEKILEWLKFSISSLEQKYSSIHRSRIKNVDNYVNPLITYAPLYANRINSPTLNKIAYDSALAYKQLSLNIDKLIKKMIISVGDESIMDLYDELQSTKVQLEKASPTTLDSLNQYILSLETKIANELKLYGDYAQGLTSSWKQIQESLKKDDIAIEFLTCKDPEELYIAVVIDKNMLAPTCIKLGDVTSVKQIQCEEDLSQLFQIVWQPFNKYLKGKKRVFFSPEGRLYQLPIEYAIDEESGIAFNEIYETYRLSSTREIIPSDVYQQHNKAVLFGGVKYCLTEEELNANNVKNANSSRGNTVDYDNISRAGLEYLPGTQIEIDSISLLLNSSKFECIINNNINASESAFKHLSGKDVSIIHIATHGFYIPATSKSKISNLYGYLNAKSSTEEVSLGRSGLMFAGSYNTLLNKRKMKDEEDGILTAREIAKMNLSTTDLIVLSACKTALGDISHEGVYGLLRGFKKAGVNTILSSLWKVDDNATQILMKEFYRYYLITQNKAEALQKAQSILRTTENGKYNNPRYWAAFIALDANR